MLSFKNVVHNMESSLQWAWLDTKCKYRRSVIGPFWETINVFVIIMGVSYMSSIIFGGNPTAGIPFIGLGIIAWSAISGIITESTVVFVNNKDSIKNSPLTIDLYVGRTIFRMFISIAHHMVLYFVGLLLLPIPFTPVALMSLIGFFFLLINSFWVVPTLGFLCARFRDLEMIVRSLLQLTFYVTPVFWDYHIITDRRVAIINFNPFFYFLEAIRAPLLGQTLSLQHYGIMIGITVGGYAILCFVYKHMRRNLAFYV